MDATSTEDNKKINELRARLVHQYEQTGGKGDIRKDQTRLLEGVLMILENDVDKVLGTPFTNPVKIKDLLHSIYIACCMGRAAATALERQKD